jgi:hypothetical protein
VSGLFDGPLHVGPITCPWCGETGPAVSQLSNPDKPHPPRPDDASVCANCAGVMVYTPFGKVRKPTEDEWREFNQNEGLTAVRKHAFMTNGREKCYSDRSRWLGGDDDSGDE